MATSSNSNYFTPASCGCLKTAVIPSTFAASWQRWLPILRSSRPDVQSPCRDGRRPDAGTGVHWADPAGSSCLNNRRRWPRRPAECGAGAADAPDYPPGMTDPPISALSAPAFGTVRNCCNLKRRHSKSNSRRNSAPIELNVSKETLTAFGPEAEVDLGHVFTSNVNWILEAGQFEDVFGHLFDVVATVADDSAQRRLANFSQLFRFEHARILVPEPATHPSKIHIWIGSQRFNPAPFWRSYGVKYSLFQDRKIFRIQIVVCQMN